MTMTNDWQFCGKCKNKNVILNWFTYNIDCCDKLCLDCYKKAVIVQHENSFWVASDNTLNHFALPKFPKNGLLKRVHDWIGNIGL